MAEPDVVGPQEVQGLSRPVIGQELVASFFTLSGAGFGEPPRNSFVERCEAAAAAGFAGIGLHWADLPRTLAAGLDVGGMRDVLAATNLRVVEIEFVGGWAFDVDEDELDRTLRGVVAVADAFGGRHVSAGEFRAAPEGGFDLDAAAARLGAIADRLADRGLIIALEAFPWSALADPGTATDILRRADSAHAGLLIDAWHFYNCGGDLAMLEGLPAGGVAAVQLNDGPRVASDFLTNARAQRKLPGDGDLDVVGLIRAVQRAGFVGPYCVEANTPEFRALPVTEAAARAAESTRAVLKAAAR